MRQSARGGIWTTRIRPARACAGRAKAEQRKDGEYEAEPRPGNPRQSAPSGRDSLLRPAPAAVDLGAQDASAPRYSTSPLPSFATRFATRPGGGREPTFSEALSELLIGFGLMERRPTLKQQLAEAWCGPTAHVTGGPGAIRSARSSGRQASASAAPIAAGCCGPFAAGRWAWSKGAFGFSPAPVEHSAFDLVAHAIEFVAERHITARQLDQIAYARPLLRRALAGGGGEFQAGRVQPGTK